MYLTTYATMDPIILMSIINMKLRNEFNNDLHDLVTTYAIDRRGLEKKLANAGFVFDEKAGKFISY